MRFLTSELKTTLAMTLTMAVGSSSILAVAVSAPSAALEIGVDASYVGMFTGFVYLVAMFTGSFSATYIARYGPIRTLQVTVIFAILGLISFVFATPLTTLACAILLGFAYGPINPANAPVLLKVTNSGNRAMVFSIKQSGVTLGGVTAALVIPLVAVWLNWQAGVVAICLLGLVTLIILRPMRAKYDTGLDKAPVQVSISALLRPVAEVARNPLLRGFSFIGFVYAGVQVSIASFFVVFLVTKQFSLVAAGVCFFFVNLGGILGRVLWGGLSDRWLTPKYTLTAIGFISAISICGLFFITTDWFKPLLYAFCFVLGGSTHGWNGVFLAEVADQSPAGQSHRLTGGVQFVIYAGVAVLPPLVGLTILNTDSYLLPFSSIAVCALVAGLALPWLYRNYPGGFR